MRASGQRGYVNDGLWQQVSIPVSAILAVAPEAGMSKVSSPLVIADRYEKTGKAQKSDTGPRSRSTRSTGRAEPDSAGEPAATAD